MRKTFLVLIAVVHCRSEGYYYDAEKNYTIYPIVENRNSEGPSLAMLQKDEDPMRFYRADVRKREPQFLGFDIQDDNIEIDMEMAVPFLSVPTMKSLSKQKNFANLNVAAVILAGVVALVGTTLGGAARFFRGDGFFNKKKPWFRTGNKKKSQKHKRDLSQEDLMWSTFNSIDEALLEIDFDLAACLQRSVCWHVKNSIINVEEKRAGKIDTFVAGFVNADWSHRAITNKYLIDAVGAAKKGQSCEKKFNNCALSAHNLPNFTEKIKKLAKQKR